MVEACLHDEFRFSAPGYAGSTARASTTFEQCLVQNLGAITSDAVAQASVPCPLATLECWPLNIDFACWQNAGYEGENGGDNSISFCGLSFSQLEDNLMANLCEKCIKIKSRIPTKRIKHWAKA